MAQHENTNRVAAHVDPHLILPLVEFLAAKNLYTPESIQRSRVTFLQHTSMVDYTMSVHRELPEFNDETQEMYAAKREKVVKGLMEVQKRCQPVIQIFNRDVMQQLSQERDTRALLDKLEKEHDFNLQHLDDLYEYSKILYEIGNYTGSTEQLQILLTLWNSNHKNYESCMWGKLACSILIMDWDTALEDLMKLRDFIENHPADKPIQVLTNRTNLLHWALFVFFNHAKGKDLLVDWYLNHPQYLNAIQTVAPHLLRYLAACAIIGTKKKKATLKDVVKNITQLSYMYKDPITDFLECLYIHYDFDAAQEKLKDCDTVLMNDFFLVACNDDFTENARLLIFENYCKIHSKISTKQLAPKLNMNTEEAEHWIVNLIRNARLDAKIDSQLGHVAMGFNPVSIHQQVIEKTSNMSYNMAKLISSIEKKKGLKNSDAFD